VVPGVVRRRGAGRAGAFQDSAPQVAVTKTKRKPLPTQRQIFGHLIRLRKTDALEPDTASPASLREQAASSACHLEHAWVSPCGLMLCHEYHRATGRRQLHSPQAYGLAREVGKTARSDGLPRPGNHIESQPLPIALRTHRPFLREQLSAAGLIQKIPMTSRQNGDVHARPTQRQRVGELPARPGGLAELVRTREGPITQHPKGAPSGKMLRIVGQGDPGRCAEHAFAYTGCKVCASTSQYHFALKSSGEGYPASPTCRRRIPTQYACRRHEKGPVQRQGDRVVQGASSDRFGKQRMPRPKACQPEIAGDFQPRSRPGNFQHRVGRAVTDQAVGSGGSVQIRCSPARQGQGGHRGPTLVLNARHQPCPEDTQRRCRRSAEGLSCLHPFSRSHTTVRRRSTVTDWGRSHTIAWRRSLIAGWARRGRAHRCDHNCAKSSGPMRSKRTRSPSCKTAGGVRNGSKSRTGQRPIRCQPPGVGRG